MLKECNVVMLPTKEKTEIYYHNPTEVLIYQQDKTYTAPEGSRDYKHIYILSNDKIKEGDWYFNKDMRTTEYGVLRADSERLAELATNAPSCVKIIASTNNALKECQCRHQEHKMSCKMQWPLPCPPETFIKEYVEKFNSFDVITKVSVEYTGGAGSYTPYVNHKFNTIDIKPIKDSFTRKEVEELILLAHGAGCLSVMTPPGLSAEDFIKENL